MPTCRVLRVDTVAGDDIVNSIEHGQALVITGGSSGLNAGAVLTVTINSVAYSTTVQADGSWSVAFRRQTSAPGLRGR